MGKYTGHIHRHREDGNRKGGDRGRIRVVIGGGDTKVQLVTHMTLRTHIANIADRIIDTTHTADIVTTAEYYPWRSMQERL